MIRKLFIAIFFWVFSFSTEAASYQGIITNVWAANGKIYLIVRQGGYDGSIGNCVTAVDLMEFEIDPATPYGRALVAIALTAKTSARIVYIAGDGICRSGPGGPAEGIMHMDFKG